MKNKIIGLLFAFVFVIPMVQAQAAGTAYSPTTISYYTLGSYNCASGYPTTTTGTVTNWTDGSNNTYTPTMATGFCNWFTFGSKKNIDGLSVTLYSTESVTTNYTFYFYDQNGNYLNSRSVSILAGSKVTGIQDITPILAYGVTFKMTGTSSVALAELKLYESPDTTPPSPPTLTATAQNLAVKLDWTKPSDIDLAGYMIFRNGTQIQTITDVNTLTTTVTNLIPGTSYTFGIKAYDDSGNQSTTTSVNATPIDNVNPTNPGTLTATGGDRQISLTWTAGTDNYQVAGYEVYLNGVLNKTVTGTSTTVTTPSNNVTYTVMVKTKDTSGNLSSGISKTATTVDTTAPPMPIMTATGQNLAVKLDWNKPSATDLTGYKIYQGTTQIADITNVNTFTYTITGLIPGTSYTYNIKSYDDSNNLSTASFATAIATDTIAPTNITNLAKLENDNQVYLSWSAGTDNYQVQGYRIYQNGTFLKDVTTTNTYISPLNNNTAYTFEIKTYDTTGNLSSGVSIQATPIDVTPPFQKPLTLGTITKTSVQIYWDYSDSVDIDYYEVTKDNFSTVTTVNHIGLVQHNYTFTGLNSGGTYTFSVKAVDDDGLKSVAQAIQATTSTTAPAVPSGLSVTELDNELQIDWNDNTETDFGSYKVYLQNNNTAIATVTSSNHDVTSLTNGVQKCYQIAAVDQYGNESAKSSIVCGTPIDLYPPFDVSNIISTGSTEYSYSFQWTKSTSPDIDKYKVYQGNVLKQIINHVATQNTYNYTANDLIPGTSYTWQVNPVDDDGNELLTGTSGTITGMTTGVAPTAPTGLVATKGIGEIQLDWNDSSEPDFDYYNVYTKDGSTYTLIATINESSYIYTTNNTNSFTFAVTTVDIGNTESAYSAAVTQSITPLTPPEPTPLFDGVTSPVTSSDIVESSFSLFGLLKWILLIGVIILIAMKFMDSIKNTANTTKPRKITTVSDEPRTNRTRRSKERQRKEKIRTDKISSNIRRKLSKSLGYKIYKR